MKNRIFFRGLLILFLIELTALILFAIPKAKKSQDVVAVNEVVQTVKMNWDALEEHNNGTALDYVVLDMDGTVLYCTKPGLSENMHAAVSHKDTILDIEIGGKVAGKLIVYNSDAMAFYSEKRAVVFVFIIAIIGQCGICAGYYFYIQYRVVKPFWKLKGFAERVAEGNLDIPLKMDRKNLFGAFTESFDIMRFELKKARLAEAEANRSKKELTAKLSHDIKTPVASIRAAAEVGAALSADKKHRENYEQIIKKADQINTLVTNLFSAALEELQELSVMPSEWSSQNLHALLEGADYLHRAVIPDVPDCMLFADRLRLQQVFDNIFANSYKYADTEINITIGMEPYFLKISMEDYGGGVLEEQLPLLKGKFQRGSNAGDIEGAGLGLYISDYCMKQMMGKLDIENGAAGLKATVWIALCSRGGQCT